ncbi:phage portal protein [Clostridium gasigenes]|uniref:phage portal protein n=1 Tax=Clostridium gasigenes TaxID=94869 RepID=UPI001C0BCE99|nr:phage portal protein [Clostridium gasigenes]MBU3135058.1 phage portal protein [Clostridium gasigenes]
MGFLTKNYNVETNIKGVKNIALDSPEFLKLFGNEDGIDKNKLGEIVYFRCLKVLSESVSKLPIELYRKTKSTKIQEDTYLDYILNVQPNPYMNSTIFWSTVEYNRNHLGNSFVYIEYGTGKNKSRIKSLWILPNNQVTILIDTKGIFKKDKALSYIFTDSKGGKQYSILKEEVIHMKSWCTENGEGISGVPVKDILGTYIERSQYGNQFLTNLTKNGMISDKIIIQYTGGLDAGAEDTLISEMERFKGKYIPLPASMSATNLSSKLTDSQYLEINKWNGNQIASAFGISPSFINDFNKASYANATSEQQSFYKNTLLSIVLQYEQELTIKLLGSKEKGDGLRFAFDVDVILRGDLTERMNAYGVAIDKKILVSDEVRGILGFSPIEGGSDLLGDGNMIKIKDIGKSSIDGGDV